ncbi:MAG: MFS transporter [Oscillospiraceae bacterium]|nr:MFS transporter [Oscillospiraceae bacterium]
MAKKTQEEVQPAPPKGRRYIGTLEKAGFVAFAASVSVKVERNDEWIDRILFIDRGMQALFNPIRAVWDMVNDVFMAAIIEKTRTRWGKFKPYLVLYPVYGLPMVLLLYALPYIFPNTPDSGTMMSKVLAWVLMEMFNEFTDTISSIGKRGMRANLTPNPEERLSLLTTAKLLNNFGADSPKLLFPIFRDVISRNTKLTQIEINQKLRGLFMGFGVGTLIVSAALALFFAVVSKERVFDPLGVKEDRAPTIKESLIALKNNRPMFMLMLSQVLGGISIRSMLGTYTNSVLNFANFGTVSGIPGEPFHYIGYSYIGWLRARFSTKTLWIVSENISKPVYIMIYFFGMLRTKTPVRGNNRMYMQLWPMLIAFAFENIALMSLYALKNVIPDEIENEIIDYGEWKNGFRSEAMVGTLKGIPPKIAGIFGNTITSILMKYIGFQGGIDYLNQTEKTTDAIFALATIVPTLFGVIALIPKFFYNINQKDREQMYADLVQRRAAALASRGTTIEEIIT